jgi:hypothetical protein
MKKLILTLVGVLFIHSIVLSQEQASQQEGTWKELEERRIAIKL